MSPIAAIGLAKAIQPTAAVAANTLVPPNPISNLLPGFQKELLKETGRSAEIAMPVDYELLSHCSEERQKQFGSAIEGKTVQMLDSKGGLQTGVVQKTWMEAGQLQLLVGGQSYGMRNLRAIYQSPLPSIRGIEPGSQGGMR